MRGVSFRICVSACVLYCGVSVVAAQSSATFSVTVPPKGKQKPGKSQALVQPAPPAAVYLPAYAPAEAASPVASAPAPTTVSYSVERTAASPSATTAVPPAASQPMPNSARYLASHAEPVPAAVSEASATIPAAAGTGTSSFSVTTPPPAGRKQKNSREASTQTLAETVPVGPANVPIPSAEAAGVDANTSAPAAAFDARTLLQVKKKPVDAPRQRIYASTTLPDGMPANPPDEEAILKMGLTWKGEYELDKNEQPLTDTDGKPVPVLYSKNGKMVRPKNVKLSGRHPATILNGVLAVDGWPAKGRLNYAVQDLRYLYFSVPGIGTVIVSPAPFAGAEEQQEAFNGDLLKVKNGDHDFQLAAEKPILGKGTQPAWVKVDAQYTADNRFPVMGYGMSTDAPYMWPGSLKATTVQGSLNAPSIPQNMRPKMASAPCPAGRICAESFQ